MPTLPNPLKFSPEKLSGVPISESGFSADSADLSPAVLSDLVARHGREFAFSRFGKLNFFVSSPSLVEEILIDKASCFLKGEEERALAAVAGWGLIAQEGVTHKSMQKDLNPGMRGKILDSYLSRLVPLFTNLISGLEDTQTGLLEFARMASQSGAEISLFGTDEPTNDFRYQAALLQTNKFAMSSASPGRGTPRSAARDFVGAKSILDNHVALLTHAWFSSDRQNPSLMDYVSLATAGLDAPEYRTRDQAGLFMQAATETTASLIGWALLHLSGRQDLWERLQEENRATGEASVSHDLLKSLEFHQAVITESLRITPPVWFISRVVAEECVIGKLRLPIGSRIVLSPWVTQRSKTSFKDPLAFSPERWVENPRGLNRGSFFPFGLGGRICIGESYGRMAAVAMLYALVASGRNLVVRQEGTDPGTSHLLTMPSNEVTFSLA